MIKTIFVFLSGAVIGWFLYPLANIPDPDRGLTSAVNIIANKGGQSEITDTNGVEINQSFQQIDDAVQHSSTESLSTAEQILVGNYSQAINDCLVEFQTREVSNCREQILEALTLIDHQEARTALEIWLNIDPEDVDAGLFMAQLQHFDGESGEAIRTLHQLEIYTSESSDVDRVKDEINRVSQSAIKSYEQEKDFNGLLQLLEVLVEVAPDNALWRLNLAKVQNHLKQYENTISSLSYILYDPVYGKQAEALYDQVNQQLDLSKYIRIPLTRIGAHYVVVAMVNGIYEVKLLIDTGASLTLIKNSTLSRIGLPAESERKITLNTAGGAVDSFLIKADTFSVGGQTINNMDIATLTFHEDYADGLLGMSFLQNFRFVIDQKQDMLLLSPR